MNSATETHTFEIVTSSTEGETRKSFTGTLSQARRAASKSLSAVDFFDARGVRLEVNGRSIGRRNAHKGTGWCVSSYGWELGLA